jgi:hypothetical protein
MCLTQNPHAHHPSRPTAATPSPLTLEANLTSLSAQLALPADTAALRAKVQAAASDLDGAAASLENLKNALNNVSSLLAAMRPISDDLGLAIGGYTATPQSEPWSGSPGSVIDVLTSGFDDIAIAAAAVSVAALSGTTVDATLQGVTAAVGSFSAERTAVAASITGIIDRIDAAPSTAVFSAALDGVQSTYNSLGSPPSRVRGWAVCVLRFVLCGVFLL